MTSEPGKTLKGPPGSLPNFGRQPASLDHSACLSCTLENIFTCITHVRVKPRHHLDKPRRLKIPWLPRKRNGLQKTKRHIHIRCWSCHKKLQECYSIYVFATRQLSMVVFHIWRGLGGTGHHAEDWNSVKQLIFRSFTCGETCQTESLVPLIGAIHRLRVFREV